MEVAHLSIIKSATLSNQAQVIQSLQVALQQPLQQCQNLRQVLPIGL
jgi:hypothetical protein